MKKLLIQHLISSLIVFLIIVGPVFFVYYKLITALTPSHEEQFARALTADCKAEWERLQAATLKRYGRTDWVNFATPDYCYDHVRNKKYYGYTN